MLTEEQTQEIARIEWIKDQLAQFDRDVMTGKMSDKEYSNECRIFCEELDGYLKKYHITDLDLLRKDPLRNMDKIWRIVGKDIRQ